MSAEESMPPLSGGENITPSEEPAQLATKPTGAGRYFVWLIPAALFAIAGYLFWERDNFLSLKGNNGADSSDTDEWLKRAVRQKRTSPFEQFETGNLTVPRDRVLEGGPPKDGIPALTNPEMVPASQAGFLRPKDRVIGVFLGKEARAYPLKIMNYHEAVNDTIGGIPLLVTYCPLCDSVAVFDRRTPDGVREFGISGLLFNSNVLLYDRCKTDKESLWTQLGTVAVSGPAVNSRLKTLPAELTTWADWSARHPQTTVLSQKTGHRRDYSLNPYAGYFASPRLMFGGVSPRSTRLPAKMPVLGVWTEKSARAYPLAAFQQFTALQRWEQQIDGRKFRLIYNPAARSLRIESAEEGIRHVYAFWFAWYAFHPNTEIAEEGISQPKHQSQLKDRPSNSSPPTGKKAVPARRPRSATTPQKT